MSRLTVDKNGTKPGLVRDLGLRHAWAVVVGTVIGSGIFLVPAEMMQAAGSTPVVFLAWAVGGMLSFFGALTYAELGAMKPEAGGEYVYLRDAYGPLAGFLYAWSWFLIAKPGSIATISTGMMRVLATLPAFAFLGRTIVSGGGWQLTWAQVGAALAVSLIAFLNYIGVRRAGEFQVYFTAFKVAVVAAIILAGLLGGAGGVASLASRNEDAIGGLTGFMVALVAALWAYDGWNNLNMVAGEVSRPGRSVPLALIGGVGTIAALYIGVQLAVQWTMPATEVAASSSPAVETIQRTLGVGAAGLFSAGIALQMMATLNGTSMSGARIPYAAARDGYFVHALAAVHPRFHTPSTAIVVQAALAIVLLMFAGTFQQLFSLTLFAEWLFYMAGTSTVFLFRKREPNAERPYRTWGYPVVPALFIMASAVILYYTFAQDLRNSLAGTLVILAGVPVFYLMANKKPASGEGGPEESAG